jgi:predicted Zn-dependent protease
MYTKGMVIAGADQRYNQFLAVAKDQIITGTPVATEIQEISERLIVAAEKWATANGKPNYLKPYKWQFTLIKEDSANAFCMAGGEIVVYTGILPYTKNNDGLACVLGHEIAHALLNHEQEDLAGGIWKQALVMNVQSNVGAVSGVVANAAATYLGTLPHSRKQETETDKVGLTLAIIAGYNGEEAIALWQRMSANGSSEKSDFTSTHPSGANRIESLKKELPIAQETAKKVLAYKTP